MVKLEIIGTVKSVINFCIILGEKPFACDLCPSSFKQSYQLTVHKRKHGLRKTVHTEKAQNIKQYVK